MTDLAAYVVLVAALTAWMCGHQGAASWPHRRAQAPVSRPQTLSRDSTAATPRVRPARGRTAPWAYTQPLTYEETP
ncbi:hypothetical protein [Streptomyces sp. enrichment culture]|uniref:hypothetical protein n=1 Tax=Streptomyces sp. enrichment culture TaxID=1795815 RepID=UPI003F5449D2